MTFYPSCLLILLLLYISTPSLAQSRISHGKKADPGDFKSVTALKINLSNGNVHCTGTILAKNWVMTASHCVGPYYIAEIRHNYPAYVQVEILAGTMDTSGSFTTNSEWSQKRISKKYFVYPDQVSKDRIRDAESDKQAMESFAGTIDIALLYVEEPFELSDYVGPVKLARDYPSGAISPKCKAVGYGIDKAPSDGPRNTHQNYLSLTIGGFDHCMNLKSYFADDASAQGFHLCMKADESYENICQGDSGGPVLCGDGDDQIQFGVASYVKTTKGNFCGSRPNKMAVYVFTGIAEEWIAETMDGISVLSFVFRGERGGGTRTDAMAYMLFIVLCVSFMVTLQD